MCLSYRKMQKVNFDCANTSIWLMFARWFCHSAQIRENGPQLKLSLVNTERTLVNTMLCLFGKHSYLKTNIILLRLECPNRTNQHMTSGWFCRPLHLDSVLLKNEWESYPSKRVLRANCTNTVFSHLFLSCSPEREHGNRCENKHCYLIMTVCG